MVVVEVVGVVWMVVDVLEKVVIGRTVWVVVKGIEMFLILFVVFIFVE